MQKKFAQIGLWMLGIFGGVSLIYCILMGLHMYHDDDSALQKQISASLPLKPHSRFSIFNHKVYVLIPGNGYLEVAQADAQNIQHLEGEAESW